MRGDTKDVKVKMAETILDILHTQVKDLENIEKQFRSKKATLPKEWFWSGEFVNAIRNLHDKLYKEVQILNNYERNKILTDYYLSSLTQYLGRLLSALNNKLNPIEKENNFYSSKDAEEVNSVLRMVERDLLELINRFKVLETHYSYDVFIKKKKILMELDLNIFKHREITNLILSDWSIVEDMLKIFGKDSQRYQRISCIWRTLPLFNDIIFASLSDGEIRVIRKRIIGYENPTEDIYKDVNFPGNLSEFSRETAFANEFLAKKNAIVLKQTILLLSMIVCHATIGEHLGRRVAGEYIPNLRGIIRNREDLEIIYQNTAEKFKIYPFYGTYVIAEVLPEFGESFHKYGKRFLRSFGRILKKSKEGYSAGSHLRSIINLKKIISSPGDIEEIGILLLEDFEIISKKENEYGNEFIPSPFSIFYTIYETHDIFGIKSKRELIIFLKIIRDDCHLFSLKFFLDRLDYAYEKNRRWIHFMKEYTIFKCVMQLAKSLKNVKRIRIPAIMDFLGDIGNIINNLDDLGEITVFLSGKDLNIFSVIPLSVLFKKDIDSKEKFYAKFEQLMITFKGNVNNKLFYTVQGLNSIGFTCCHVTNAFSGGNAGTKEQKHDPFVNIVSDLTNRFDYNPSVSIIGNDTNSSVVRTGRDDFGGSIGVIYDFGYIYQAFNRDVSTRDVIGQKSGKSYRTGNKLYNVDPYLAVNFSGSTYNEVLLRKWTVSALFYTKGCINSVIERLKQISNDFSFKEYFNGAYWYRTSKYAVPERIIKVFPVYEIDTSNNDCKIVYMPENPNYAILSDEVNKIFTAVPKNEYKQPKKPFALELKPEDYFYYDFYSKLHHESKGFDIGKTSEGTWGRSAAGILIINPDSNEILLLKRSASVFEPNIWAIPGGARKETEKGLEDPLITAVSESKEEMGGLPKGKIRKIFYVYKKPGSGFTYVTYILETESRERNNFVPTLNLENTDWKWFRIEDAKKMKDVHKGVIEVLEKYF